MRLWAVIVLGLSVASGACAPSENGEPRPIPAERSIPPGDPTGAVLRYRISGGIAGHADEVTVDADLRARHRVFGKLQLDWHLDGEDATELRRLVRDGQAFASESHPEEGVADGLSESLVFTGRGAQDERSDVAHLASRLLQHATAVVEVSRHPVVVIGEMIPGTQSGSALLLVQEVLKSDLDDGVLQFAEPLRFTAPPPRAMGRGVWGLWLAGPEGRRRGPIRSWRYAPPILQAHIVATIGPSRPGPPTESDLGELALTLRAEPDDPRVGDAIRLHLTARNLIDTAKTVIRPRPRMLDTFGSWGGWYVRIEGPAGSYEPEPLPGGFPPVTRDDLVHLAAGASFEVVIDLERFVLGGVSASPPLTRTPGEFRAAVSYDGGAPEIGMQPSARPAISPPVRFTIAHLPR